MSENPEKRYRLNPDSVTREDRQALAKWLTSEPAPQLTMGPLTKEYEEGLAKWMGVRYAVAENSGSSANELMAYALLRSGWLKNKKVIVPSAAWVTSISPFLHFGYEPVMCEADPDNWGLDPVHLEELLKQHQPSTVMLVHVLGVPANMEEIMRLKDQYHFFLLEDTCAAMGSTYSYQKAGTFGIMSSISSYYGHQFSTIEGGVVFTNDIDLYSLILMLRNHGNTAQLDFQTKEQLLHKYNLDETKTNFNSIEPGFNVRLTEIQAFLGLRQLTQLDWLVHKRFANHQLYKKILGPHFQTQKYHNEDTICSIHFCASAKNKKERNKIMAALEKEGISTRPFIQGNQGRHPYWFREYGQFGGIMADRLYDCGFFLPNHPYLEKEDIEFICNIVLKSANQKT